MQIASTAARVSKCLLGASRTNYIYGEFLSTESERPRSPAVPCCPFIPQCPHHWGISLVARVATSRFLTWDERSKCELSHTEIEQLIHREMGRHVSLARL